MAAYQESWSHIQSHNKKKIMKQWTCRVLFLSLDEILNNTIPFSIPIYIILPLITAMKTGMAKGRLC
jgi:hypothetical protein